MRPTVVGQRVRDRGCMTTTERDRLGLRRRFLLCSILSCPCHGRAPGDACKSCMLDTLDCLSRRSMTRRNATRSPAVIIFRLDKRRRFIQGRLAPEERHGRTALCLFKPPGCLSFRAAPAHTLQCPGCGSMFSGALSGILIKKTSPITGESKRKIYPKPFIFVNTQAARFFYPSACILFFYKLTTY
jgi:hypothetical protein